MEGFDLVINTLELIKALHEKPSEQGGSGLVKEQVVLAPKTLEQLELSLLEARKLSFSPRSKPKFAKSNVYEGISQGEMAWKVLKNGDLFVPKPSLAVNTHSPDGFSWGYAGSGPAQLALAILMSGAHHKEENCENDYQNEIDCYTCATRCAYVYVVTDVNDPSGVDYASNYGGYSKIIANPSGNP